MHISKSVAFVTKKGNRDYRFILQNKFDVCAVYGNAQDFKNYTFYDMEIIQQLINGTLLSYKDWTCNCPIGDNK